MTSRAIVCTVRTTRLLQPLKGRTRWRVERVFSKRLRPLGARVLSRFIQRVSFFFLRVELLARSSAVKEKSVMLQARVKWSATGVGC